VFGRLIAVNGDRRRDLRLTAENNIRCTITGTEVVHVIGLGSEGSGMRVLTNKELPDGELQISLQLDDGGPSINLTGNVVWRESWDFDAFRRHISGLATHNLPEEAQARLSAVLTKKPTEASED
jgi:hypothetical protein